MKKFLLGLFFVFLVQAVQQASAGELQQNSSIVNVSTAGVTALPANPSRKYAIFINADDTDTIWIATSPITSTTYHTVGAIAIGKDFDKYVDNFWVYLSTWYAASTGPAVLSISEKQE